MNINDLTFGIELETTIPTGACVVGPYPTGIAIDRLPGWKTVRDGSIRATRGREACEFVSPVYQGIAGMQQLVADIAIIKSMGATVNSSCGMHVHIGFDKSNTGLLEKLAALVASQEQGLFAATGTKNRQRGRWCRSIARHGNPTTARVVSSQDRYHVLNMGTEHKTVEFRAFAGTLNTGKIIAYVRLCLGMVERAHEMTRIAKWTPKTPVATSPIHRNGEGLTALNRLMYKLGWTLGQAKRTYGNAVAQGLPSLKASKKVLMKLAQKYDQQR